MEESIAKINCQTDDWDDTLLVKTYDDSLKLAREELARRIAISTSKDVGPSSNERDYVRATYDDGIDYEAKILAIDGNSGTCKLKYIGYENEQEMLLDNLITSWGKKARRLQFAKVKLLNTEEPFNADITGSKTLKKRIKSSNIKSIPPPPPMPPMLSATQNREDSEHLSAMLMSWYMSGYYTGVYQGMQMAKTSSCDKKQ